MRYLFLILIILIGCKDKNTCPTMGVNRCNGEILQICDSSKRWQKIIDCKNLSKLQGQDLKCDLNKTRKRFACIRK